MVLHVKTPPEKDRLSLLDSLPFASAYAESAPRVSCAYGMRVDAELFEDREVCMQAVGGGRDSGEDGGEMLSSRGVEDATKQLVEAG
jgi:hypothetical protein